MKKSDIFWQTYLSLEKELINVSNFIFITDEITTHERGLEVTKPCNSQLEAFFSKWHHIPAGRELTKRERLYAVSVLMTWIKKEYEKSTT